MGDCGGYRGVCYRLTGRIADTGLERLPRSAEGDAACRYVSSRGLLFACDDYIRGRKTKRLKTRALLRLKMASLGQAEILHIQTYLVSWFAIHGLPRMRRPFRLVTGDAIVPVGLPDVKTRGPDSPPEELVRRIADHPLLIAWHSQNLCFRHPKLFPIPLGMDYHTLSNLGQSDTHSWGAHTSSVAQERQFMEIAAAAPTPSARTVAAFSNWHFSPDRGNRRDCLERAAPEAVHYQEAFLPRAESWQLNARFAFTLSPFGAGLDCHRTWEALGLGSIPIVMRSPLEPLFEGLPVVIVDDWREVTPERLATEQERLMPQRFKFSRLDLSYWVARIRGTAPPPARMMTLDQFVAG